MLECVALSDEAFNFWGEVGVVSFSVASGDVYFVCVVYYGVELLD